MELGLLLLSYHLWCLAFAFGFNLDTQSPVIMKGPPGTYFGYSVTFHKNGKGIWALVGAPKGNTEVYPYVVHQPGVVHKCSWKGVCSELVVDRTGPEPNNDLWNVKYKDYRNRMWLGVDVGVQKNTPNRVLVCGHRWKNSLFHDALFINGVCYMLDEYLQENSSRKLLPLIGTRHQQQNAGVGYLYALGLAGASFTFTEDSQFLLLGGPGLYSWRGSVILYEFVRGDISNPRVLGVLGEVEQDSYYGYSVASGTFFEDSEVRFAVGAPRDNSYAGAVYFIKVQINVQTSQFKLLGSRLGSYFGSSMASVNLTRGKFSSLLVGAPFTSTESGGDEGQVHVYVSNGKVLREQNVLVVGSSFSGARFGSAISEVGDLNQDSFTDVAVGAPYQDEGLGAVYIYHGGPTGLRCSPAPQICRHAQVIKPSTTGWGVTGFGSSLGLPMDVDDNGTPDVIIGSYTSDNVVVLRSSPVIQIYLTMNASVDGLDRNGNSTTKGFCHFNGKNAFCFNITVCALVTGTSNVTSNFTMNLEMDPYDSNHVRQTRRYYLDSLPDNNLARNLTLDSDVKQCFGVNITLPYDDFESQNYDTPVLIKLDAVPMPPSRPNFCKACAVLDPENVTSIFKEIPFITGCGLENRCVPDLDVKAGIVDWSDGDVLVSGENRTLTLEVNVSSKGDPAYLAVLSILLPDGVNVVNQANCHIRKSQIETMAISLQCRLGDPFRSTESRKFRLVLDISKLPISEQLVEIVLRASCKDKQKNSANNEQLIQLLFRTDATIKITGEAEKGSYFYDRNDKRLPIVHRYSVKSSGPSPIDVVKLQIRVPVRNLNTGRRFLSFRNIQVIILTSDSGIQSFCNVSSEVELPNNTLFLTGDKGDETNYDVADGDVPLPKPRGDVPNDIDLTPISARPRTDDGTTFYEINCETAECETIVCFLGPFPGQGQEALVVIPAEVDLEAIKGIGGDAENVTLVSYGEVEALETNLFPHARASTQVYILLVQLFRPSTLPVPSWVIAVSAGGGFLLLALLILGLVQLGFFHRRKHEELKKLVAAGQVENPSVDHDGVLEEDQNDHELPDMTDNVFPDLEND